MRRCEIHKIGIDIPCGRKAPHFLKLVSKKLGTKGKFKIWLCKKHRDMVEEKSTLTDFLDSVHLASNDSIFETSDRFQAHLSR